MNWKNILLFTVVTVITLVFAEIVVRAVLPHPGFKSIPVSYLPGLLVHHPIRDYSYAPDFSGTIYAEEYQVDINTNSMGLRDRQLSADEKVDIIASGNSFTVGFGVQAEESWPSQLEAYINSNLSHDSVRVLNAGISGYSLTQIRLIIEELLHLKPDKVVLGLYPSRYWRIKNPYVFYNGIIVVRNTISHIKPTEGGLLYSNFTHKRIQKIHFWMLENFYLGAHSMEMIRKLIIKVNQSDPPLKEKEPGTKDLLAPLLNELGNISQVVSAYGIELIVLLINHQEADGSFNSVEKEYNAIVKSYCSSKSIKVFDPVPYFESVSEGQPLYRFRNDHHWNKNAHALVGKEFGDFLLMQNSDQDTLNIRVPLKE